MRIALEEAKQGDAPFGAVLVKDSQIIAKAYNTVRTDSDPSAHAEVNAIRRLTAAISHPSLEGYTLYTTGEPCPMCAAACVWAGVSEIVFGVSIADLMAAGVSQIEISCQEIIAKGFRKIKVTGGVLSDECLQLFQEWKHE